MATLIAVYNSEGCVGRCDERCYAAKNPECKCVCGGMNHGKGLRVALDNTREHYAQFLADYAHSEGLRFNDVKFDVPARQMDFLQMVRRGEI